MHNIKGIDGTQYPQFVGSLYPLDIFCLSLTPFMYMQQLPTVSQNQSLTCPVCESSQSNALIDLLRVPVHCNVLWRSAEEARRAPRGDSRLKYCQDCGHVYNSAFQPEAMQYDQLYENSLHFSVRFQQYAISLAHRLVETYDLRHKRILEIGCGKGDFLRLLCELGDNQGIGFDPSYEEYRTEGSELDRIRFIPDFYSEKYADVKADLICCRHVLEHIQNPREFILSVRHAIGSEGTSVYFEVPNVRYTLEQDGIWDLIYEHPSYFSAGSLTRLFESCGFVVQACEPAFGGQYLGLEAKPTSRYDLINSHRQHNQLNGVAAKFAESFRGKVEHWRTLLEECRNMKKKVVVWGSGSKGVTFLNIMGEVGLAVEFVVDINPHKQGMYVAGTGHEIVSPERMAADRPDVIIVMNAIYADEIRRQIEELGLTAEIVTA